jgi:cation transporter-like permease
VGAPSQALERAAAWERGYVTKDFRRMAIVVVIAMVLLIVAGVILNVFEH